MELNSKFLQIYAFSFLFFLLVWFDTKKNYLCSIKTISNEH